MGLKVIARALEANIVNKRPRRVDEGRSPAELLSHEDSFIAGFGYGPWMAAINCCSERPSQSRVPPYI